MRNLLWLVPVAAFFLNPSLACSDEPAFQYGAAEMRAAVEGDWSLTITPDGGTAMQVTVHVELTLKDRATVEAFESRIAAFDEVVECHRMFGLPDYIVRVAVADQAAYEAFYMNKLAELPGLARVNSQFAMKVVKRGGTLPV